MNTFVNPFGFNTTPWFNNVPGFSPINNLWNSCTSAPINGQGWNLPFSGYNAGNGWNTGINGFQNNVPFGFNIPTPWGFNSNLFNGFGFNPIWNNVGLNAFGKSNIPGFTPGFTPTPGITSGGFTPGFQNSLGWNTPAFGGVNTPWNVTPWNVTPWNVNGFTPGFVPGLNTGAFSTINPWNFGGVPFGFNVPGLSSGFFPGFVPGFIPGMNQPSQGINTPGVPPGFTPGIPPGMTPGYNPGFTPGYNPAGVGNPFPGNANSNLCREAA
ncbi:MAG: hypothetical protein IBJ10_00270 [Phycisphaerales bacterium]|nr:hypothetical protein [Phycisphaerales bacterium]